MPDIIGRDHEIGVLKEACAQDKPEFIAIYGRRRIGKTYLVQNLAKELVAKDECIYFDFTGANKIQPKIQIETFYARLREWLNFDMEPKQNWIKAFEDLYVAVKNLLDQHPDKKPLLFIDELPWAAYRKTDEFLTALGLFWEKFNSHIGKGVLIVCGSATTWMITNLFSNTKHLYQRITRQIHMEPFYLGDTERYLQHNGFELSRKSVIECYMVFGGVAQYLSMLNPKKTIAENVQEICFNMDGQLVKEYDNMFASLFSDHNTHKAIIDQLSSQWSGIHSDTLKSRLASFPDSTYYDALRELEQSDFIQTSPAVGPGGGTMIRVKDPFCYFHTKWQAMSRKDRLRLPSNYWQNIVSSNSQAWISWSGYAFENICILHDKQYLKVRGILGTSANILGYRHKAVDTSDQGAQVDMLVDRGHGVLEIVECKFYDSEFTIDAQYKENLEKKKAVVWKHLKPKQLFLTMLTTYGVKKNAHYSELNISGDYNMDCLFEDVL